MKNYFQKTCCLLSFLFLSFSMLAWKSPLSWYVSSDTEDKSLKKNEALILFKFTEYPGGKPVQNDIKMSVNGKELLATRDASGNFSLKVSPGKNIFQFFYNLKFGEITTDSVLVKGAHKLNMQVQFMSSVEPVICFKPVIYVYPEKTTEMKVQLDLKGPLTFTYPEYAGQWKFIADSTGTLHFGEKKFNYIFWEGVTEISLEPKISNTSSGPALPEGFYVPGDSSIQFLEEKLSAMNLNDQEKEDFITYWAPQLSANKFNFVHFIFNQEFNECAKLTIEPKPDNVFRVFMVWNKADDADRTACKEQEIPKVQRKGLTVIEWGGTQKKINCN
jgi:hypothetical protein